MWRCPHCGTPQAEASRCWVCHRSSTTCSTCRHFRRSVAAQLGYCGLDARRLPLTGAEMRGCWEPAAARPVQSPADGRPVEGPAPGVGGDRRHRRTDEPAAAWPDDEPVRLRDFVPVELRRDHRIVVRASDRRAGPPEPPAEAAVSEANAAPRAVSLPAALNAASSRLTFFGNGDGDA
jgi:hypothetical protein